MRYIPMEKIKKYTQENCIRPPFSFLTFLYMSKIHYMKSILLYIEIVGKVKQNVFKNKLAFWKKIVIIMHEC